MCIDVQYKAVDRRLQTSTAQLFRLKIPSEPRQMIVLVRYTGSHNQKRKATCPLRFPMPSTSEKNYVAADIFIRPVKMRDRYRLATTRCDIVHPLVSHAPSVRPAERLPHPRCRTDARAKPKLPRQTSRKTVGPRTSPTATAELWPKLRDSRRTS